MCNDIALLSTTFYQYRMTIKIKNTIRPAKFADLLIYLH